MGSGTVSPVVTEGGVRDPASPRRVELLVAIPALDEEASIESIIERTVAARDTIIAGAPVTDVHITVVSDGSTDRTVELAQRHLDDIDIIIFERNRGYGAAIKEAWAHSDAELLGFLDADGTCDPEFFATLCRELYANDADVALGARLNPESRMPVVRRIGNRVFAWLLTAFSSERVHDTASGMRVVRASSLPRLLPLPDGLHFTPAMSTRVLLDDDLSLVEVDMAYAEREGRSKLRIGRDGLRFLGVILRAAALYRPARLLGAVAAVCAAAAIALMVQPTVHYLQHREVLDWMVYRFVVASLAGMAAMLFAMAGYLTARIVDITLTSPKPGLRARMHQALASKRFWLFPLLLAFGGGLLVLPGFIDLVRTGSTDEHWSRFIAMSQLCSVALIVVVTRVIDSFLSLLAERLAELERAATAAAPAAPASTAAH